MQTRRKFLRDCSIAAVTTSVIPSTALTQNHFARMTIANGPGLEQFARHLQTTFTARTSAMRVKLILVEAEAFTAATPNSEDARNEKFTLLFRGPTQQPLEQDNYLFEHPHLGRNAIFIVPIGCPDPAHCYYEAIFDRPINASELARQMANAPRRIQNV